MYKRVENAAKAVLEACGGAELGLILGSGLSENIIPENEKSISYKDIPGFPVSGVSGHGNKWSSGVINGKNVCIMRGRFHSYEGYSGEDIALPIRIMKLLGVKNIIITNAAGGVNIKLSPGRMMLVNDHINFGIANPLVGANDERFGPRFPDMTHPYSPSLLKLAKDCAEETGVTLAEGVYACMSGPSYETPAEIRMLRTLGADAVGMSTVPEVIAARHCGINVLCISCITNMASGILDAPLSHEEVISTGKAIASDFSKLINLIISRI